MQQKISFNQSLHQKMVLTPALIQSLKILQLSKMELADYVNQELSENPFLEETQSNNNEIDENSIVDLDETIHKLEYLDEISDSGNYIPANPEKLDTTSIIERTATETETIYEHLINQLRFDFDSASEEYSIGEMLISYLDEDGFLDSENVKQVILHFKNKDKVESILQIIQKYDPPGIAARSIKESLLNQLSEINNDPATIEKQIIEKCFNLLHKKKISEISKIISTSKERIKQAIAVISHLEPKPARKFSSSNNSAILPDIIIKPNQNNDFDIIIDDEIIPKIVFNNYYKKLRQLKENLELKKFLSEKESRALNLINSIKYRKDNLFKVTSAIITLQTDFFKHGPKSLKPYTLVALAKELNINEGTLSRIVNSKYMQTDWGVYPLKYFFTSTISSEKGDISSTNVKENIKDILENYDGGKRLSDQKIVNILEKKGIKIARRTVAKYRKGLNILSSFDR